MCNITKTHSKITTTTTTTTATTTNNNINKKKKKTNNNKNESPQHMSGTLPAAGGALFALAYAARPWYPDACTYAKNTNKRL